MAVVGYNYDPESADPVIGVEMEQRENGEPVACLYIDEGHNQTEMKLDYYEMGKLIGTMQQVRHQIAWKMARYAYANQHSGATTHLVAVTFEDLSILRQLPALCGRAEQYNWSLDPVVGHEPEGCCKKCLATYRKITGRKEQG